MEDVWRKAEKDEIEIMRKAEKENFKGNIIVTLILFGIIVIIVLGIVKSFQNIEESSYARELLGYDPDNPPRYNSYLSIMTSEEYQMQPGETYEEYMMRMSMNPTDFSSMEEEFYEKQKKDIESALEKASDYAFDNYKGKYLLVIVLGGIAIGLCIGCCYLFMEKFDGEEIFVKYGICIGKEQRRYRHSRFCYMTIKINEDKRYEMVRIKGYAYDTISFEDKVLLVKSNYAEDEIAGVYLFKKADNQVDN